MNATSKVDAILNAWFDYIALDDYSKAGIDIDKDKDLLNLHGVTIELNRVFIEQNTFSELQQKVIKGQQGKQETVWALSFPQIRTQAG
ncbi:hypothetical protein VB735_27060 [Halotia wernerae UHCC 0503]|nr:hypothetical protein [Halotia wernerae UHCC 0503]